jgi:flagellar hook protein FlgE
MQIGAIAQSGLYQALRRFDASAQRVAQAGASVGDVDLAAEAVEQVSSVHAVKANIATLETGNAMFKQLLDIKV